VVPKLSGKTTASLAGVMGWKMASVAVPILDRLAERTQPVRKEPTMKRNTQNERCMLVDP